MPSSCLLFVSDDRNLLYLIFKILQPNMLVVDVEKFASPEQGIFVMFFLRLI